jgi:Putative Ig domain
MRGLIVTSLVVLAFAPLVGQASTVRLQHVTVIGDSVADGMAGDSAAVATLGAGIDLDLETAPCRRVDQDSCPIGGVRPPNVVQFVNAMGSKLGPNVVVAVGYNDFEDQYATNIETALSALKAAGVKRVWWLTLRAAHHGYISMNADIEAAAQKHPELEVIDWNVYSRSHPEWFQNDGLHLLAPGAEAMARLIHQQLVADGIAVKPVIVVTETLPVAQRDRPYHATLVPANGLPPFQWSLLERAPEGLRLLAGGKITGEPRVAAGRYTFDVRVRDSAGSTATRRLTLRVRR